MRKIIIGLFFSALVAYSAQAYPQRIVSGIPSATETLFALGLGDRVVGVTTNCNYPPEAARKPKVGGFALNLERVVSLQPDLLVLDENLQQREIDRCRALRIPLLTLKPKTIDEVCGSIVNVADVAGVRERGEKLSAAIKRRVAAVEPKRLDLLFVLRRPRVLVIVGNEPLIVAGGGTLIDDILKRLGAENQAAGARSAYPQYSYERLLKDDPDYIIVPRGMVRRGEIEQRGKWPVLCIDPDLIARAGPRIADAVEQIARFINEKKI
jgi:iron complex transport system substrate-binding protein